MGEYPRKDSAASKDEESPRTLTSIAEDDSAHEIRFSVLAEVRDPSDFSEETAPLKRSGTNLGKKRTRKGKLTRSKTTKLPKKGKRRVRRKKKTKGTGRKPRLI